MSKKFARVQVVVGTVICKSNKYLLVQEGKKAIRGLWNIPAGRVEVGDTIEHRAIQEIFEETGYRAKLKRKLFVEHNQADQPVRHAFEGRIIGGTMKIPPREILDCGWFAWREIQKMKSKMRHQWIVRAISIVEYGKS